MPEGTGLGRSHANVLWLDGSCAIWHRGAGHAKTGVYCGTVCPSGNWVHTGVFTLSDRSAEPKGYLSVHQTPDNIIHLISSKQYYAFNLAWLKQDPPQSWQ